MARTMDLTEGSILKKMLRAAMPTVMNLIAVCGILQGGYYIATSRKISKEAE